MIRTITIIGYALIFISIATANTWAHRHPKLLVPLGYIIERLLADRTMRIAFAIIWWWIGWHFLYATI